jgi:hypothetical protein
MLGGSPARPCPGFCRQPGLALDVCSGVFLPKHHPARQARLAILPLIGAVRRPVGVPAPHLPNVSHRGPRIRRCRAVRHRFTRAFGAKSTAASQPHAQPIMKINSTATMTKMTNVQLVLTGTGVPLAFLKARLSESVPDARTAHSIRDASHNNFLKSSRVSRSTDSTSRTGPPRSTTPPMPSNCSRERRRGPAWFFVPRSAKFCRPSTLDISKMPRSAPVWSQRVRESR